MIFKILNEIQNLFNFSKSDEHIFLFYTTIFHKLLFHYNILYNILRDFKFKFRHNIMIITSWLHQTWSILYVDNYNNTPFCIYLQILLTPNPRPSSIYDGILNIFFVFNTNLYWTTFIFGFFSTLNLNWIHSVVIFIPTVSANAHPLCQCFI